MKTILIIDDQDRIRKTYRQVFERDGYTVFDASNAAKSYQVIKNVHIDLVLLDIKMPEIDGTLFYEVLNLFHKDIKIIVSSVYPVDEQHHLIKRADDYFDKSEGIKVLRSKVKKALADDGCDHDVSQKGGAQ